MAAASPITPFVALRKLAMLNREGALNDRQMTKAFSLLLTLWLVNATAGEPAVVLAHPPFTAFYSCAEHGAGQLPELGDALGTDCFVQKLVEVEGRIWLRAHAGDGRKNEDWYGWNEPVLSPCECVVLKVQDNPNVNEPGILGTPPAAYVLLERSDGVHFMVAHVQGVSVREGQQLKYGEPFAKVGNNGYARQPHVHLGAWSGDSPLQIRFDQRFMGEPQFLPAAAQQGAPLGVALPRR